MTKEWLVNIEGMRFNNKTTVSLALEKLPGDNVTFVHPEKSVHVIEYAAYKELKEAIQYYFDVLREVQGRNWDKNPDHVLEKMLDAMANT